MWKAGEVIQMSEYCPDCGTELRKDARFCEGCGKQIIQPIHQNKTKEQIEKDLKEKIEEEYKERELEEFRKLREKELREEKNQEIEEKKRKAILEQLKEDEIRAQKIMDEKKREKQQKREIPQGPFKKEMIIMAVALCLAILFTLIIIVDGHNNFNGLIKGENLGGNNEYWTTSGLPLEFQNISNTPATNHVTVVSYYFINLIFDFILYVACFFIFFYLVIIILIKRKILNQQK